LILGQGMLTAGWHPHTLNAPGKFLVSAPEHDTPRRARAYLITDQVVAETAARHAGFRPPLDEISRHAIEIRPSRHQPTDPRPGRHQPADPDPGPPPAPGRAPAGGDDPPELMLWAALSLASADGASVADLMTATGMSRRWVYYRLRSLADAGRITQTETGN